MCEVFGVRWIGHIQYGCGMAFELTVERVDAFAGVMPYKQDPAVTVAVRHGLVGRARVERVVRDELHVQSLRLGLRVSAREGQEE